MQDWSLTLRAAVNVVKRRCGRVGSESRKAFSAEELNIEVLQTEKLRKRAELLLLNPV